MLKDTQLNTVIDKHKCTMCGACYNVCPVKAIEIKEDADGFAYPHINKDKCTNCGLCTKRCPALHPQNTSEIVEKLPAPVCYGGYSKNDEVREKSSSGGVFSILADYVLSKGGYVCGAKFVKGATLEHVIINNKEDLAPLRGSKYVQSNVHDVYKKIKKLLEKDNYVLFTGTPCQVAALYQVLGKDYEKLLTIDLLCLGVPPQKLFKTFLKELTNGQEKNVRNISFRDKSQGWKEATFTYMLNDKKYEHKFYETAYGKAFGQYMSIRKSCAYCAFAKTPRHGDFTIGDFWGVKDKNLDDNKGTSAILANTAKAQNILKNIKNKFKIIKQVKLNEITKINHIDERQPLIHANRNSFFESLKHDYKNVSEKIEAFLNKSDGIAILNCHWAKFNYGSILTAYALQEKIRKYGYNPQNVRLRNTLNDPDASNFTEFQQKYIEETPYCEDSEAMKTLNKYYKTFIVGPDIMFMNYGITRNFYDHLFEFAPFSKNLCSFAASFGQKNMHGCYLNNQGKAISVEEDIQNRKRLFKRFSLISVREKSGIDMCKNLFDVDATHILDAVFLLRQNEWNKLIQQSDINVEKNTIARYILNYESLPQDMLSTINNLNNVVNLYKADNFEKIYTNAKEFSCSGPKIEDFLKIISQAQTVIADSYHGLCFAIIFRRNFIVTAPLASERHSSLLKMFNLEDRIALTKNDFIRLLNTPVDYTKVEPLLEKYISEADDFLQQILKFHETRDKTRSYLEALELRMELNELQQKGDTPPYYKQKLYLFGLPLIKTKIKNGKKKVYFLGLHLITISEKKNTKRYKLFGIELLKRKNK